MLVASSLFTKYIAPFRQHTGWHNDHTSRARLVGMTKCVHWAILLSSEQAKSSRFLQIKLTKSTQITTIGKQLNNTQFGVKNTCVKKHGHYN
jgi:hypothetical protein